MEFYIKEWTDKTASLITRDGYRLWTFASVESALTACRDWYKVSEDRIIPNLGCETKQAPTCSSCAA